MMASRPEFVQYVADQVSEAGKRLATCGELPMPKPEKPKKQGKQQGGELWTL